MNLAVRLDEALKTPSSPSFSIYVARSAEAAQKDLAVRNFDAVVAEPRSVRQTCLQLINLVRKARPECAIALICDDFSDESESLAALSLGAQYCASVSSLRPEEFAASLKAAIARQQFINSTIKKYRRDDSRPPENDLLASLNYGVRTTLTSIAGMGELLLKTPLSEEQKEYADIISKSCSQLLKSLNDALTGFKTEQEKTPVCGAADGVPPPPRAAAETAKNIGWGENFTVLVTEDNLFNQKLIQSFLTKKGVTSIETAMNGMECVEIYKNKKISAVIMDCQMPVMDGMSAARAIREYEKEAGKSRVPIIALTADTIEGTREKCLANGMDDYLTKPIDFDRLYDKLARIALVEKRTATAPGTPPAAENGPGEPPQGQVFDPRLIEDLKKLQVPGRPSIIGQLFGIYLSETGAKIENLKKAVAEKNPEAVKHVAHNLKSSTANVGGVRLSAIFKSMELKAKTNDLEGLESMVEAVEANYRLLAEKLTQFLENKERP